jgi:hypothetical protein
MRVASVLWIVVVALFLSLGSGFSGSSSYARTRRSALAKAKRLFKKGQVEYRVGHFKRALDFFKASLKLANRPSIIFNIAQCYRFMEQPKKALFFYRLYLSEWERAKPGTRPANYEEVQEFIRQLKREREALEAKASLLLSGVPAKAEVLIDGKRVALGPPGAPLKVAPGDHIVKVAAAGSRPWSRSIEVKARQQIEYTVRLQPLAPKRSTFWLVSGISTAVLALGAEGAAVAFTVKTNNEYTGTDRFYTFRNVAIASHVIAGTLAIAAGISFYLYWRSGRRPANVSLLPGPGGREWSVCLRF